MKRMLIVAAVTAVAVVGVLILFGGDEDPGTRDSATAVSDADNAKSMYCAAMADVSRIRERLDEGLDTRTDAMSELRAVQLALEAAEAALKAAGELGAPVGKRTASDHVAGARRALEDGDTTFIGYKMSAESLGAQGLKSAERASDELGYCAPTSS